MKICVGILENTFWFTVEYHSLPSTGKVLLVGGLFVWMDGWWMDGGWLLGFGGWMMVGGGWLLVDG